MWASATGPVRGRPEPLAQITGAVIEWIGRTTASSRG
jgi:hypothetical protein